MVGISATAIAGGLITPSYADQAYMTLAGITSFMAQMFMISALKVNSDYKALKSKLKY